MKHNPSETFFTAYLTVNGIEETENPGVARELVHRHLETQDVSPTVYMDLLKALGHNGMRTGLLTNIRPGLMKKSKGFFMFADYDVNKAREEAVDDRVAHLEHAYTHSVVVNAHDVIDRNAQVVSPAEILDSLADRLSPDLELPLEYDRDDFYKRPDEVQGVLSYFVDRLPKPILVGVNPGPPTHPW